MLFTFILIFLPIIQTISIVDQQQQQQHRFRRAWINFFSDETKTEVSAKGGSSINSSGNNGDLNQKGSDRWLNMVKNQTGRVMQGGTDLILTPVNWLTNLTNNWPLYLVYFTLFIKMKPERRTNERILSAPFSSVDVKNHLTQNHNQIHMNPLISLRDFHLHANASKIPQFNITNIIQRPTIMFSIDDNFKLDSNMLMIIILTGLFLLVLAKFTTSIIMDIFKLYQQGLHFHYPVPHHHVIIDFQHVK
ncbi:unnamed protein product [Adineta ricciae]|uniref:Uncharacterized protein n=1 Tax=Adineta ricciae TaxID=249248 RepID=A0A815WZU3_ADIRI|nr:unnamed protein product [Adineta ricciae]